MVLNGDVFLSFFVSEIEESDRKNQKNIKIITRKKKMKVLFFIFYFLFSFELVSWLSFSFLNFFRVLFWESSFSCRNGLEVVVGTLLVF